MVKRVGRQSAMSPLSGARPERLGDHRHQDLAALVAGVDPVAAQQGVVVGRALGPLQHTDVVVLAAQRADDVVHLGLALLVLADGQQQHGDRLELVEHLAEGVGERRRVAVVVRPEQDHDGIPAGVQAAVEHGVPELDGAAGLGVDLHRPPHRHEPIAHLTGVPLGRRGEDGVADHQHAVALGDAADGLRRRPRARAVGIGRRRRRRSP